MGASANEEDEASSHNVASQVSQLSPLAFVKEVGWTRKLFAWFLGEYERTRRYTAYLFGKGGEGKTRTVRALLQGKNVFECRLTEPYAFDGFDAHPLQRFRGAVFERQAEFARKDRFSADVAQW